MHFFIANHRIGTFTSESRATIEGAGEGGDHSVVVKETGRYGLYCRASREGGTKINNFWVIGKEILRDGSQ